MKLGGPSAFNDAWCLEQAARNQHIDLTEININGRSFCKSLALACPECGAVFFHYQRVGHEGQPYVDPAGSLGLPTTCGDPRCREAAEKKAVCNSEEYKRNCRKYFEEKDGRGTKPSPNLEPKLVKLGAE